MAAFNPPTSLELIFERDGVIVIPNYDTHHFQANVDVTKDTFFDYLNTGNGRYGQKYNTTFAYSELEILIDKLKANTHLRKLYISSINMNNSEATKALINSFRDKANMKDVEIYGNVPYEISEVIMSMITTLELQSLNINFDLNIEVLNKLHEIKKLDRLILSSQEELDSEDWGPFIIPLMSQVNILELNYVVTQSQLDIVADNLRTNEVLRILRFKSMNLDVTSLGSSLKVNTYLQSLTIDNMGSDLSLIFDGLRSNKTVLKVQIYEGSTGYDIFDYLPEARKLQYIPALVAMLGQNNYLEILRLTLMEGNDQADIDKLITAVAASSLIELELEFDSLPNPNHVMYQLVQALTSNTTLTKLDIHHMNAYLELSINLELLASLMGKNFTLETLIIDELDFFDEVLLDDLLNRRVIDDDDFKLCQFIYRSLERNASNRKHRQVSLFDLMS